MKQFVKNKVQLLKQPCILAHTIFSDTFLWSITSCIRLSNGTKYSSFVTKKCSPFELTKNAHPLCDFSKILTFCAFVPTKKCSLFVTTKMLTFCAKNFHLL